MASLSRISFVTWNDMNVVHTHLQQINIAMSLKTQQYKKL